MNTDQSNYEDLIKVNKEQIDSLILYHRKVEEIRRTRFYKFYTRNPITTNIEFKFNPLPSLNIDHNELEDENDEFLRSFVAVMRLFTLDRDRFSLGYLGDHFFNEDDGALFNLYPNEAKLFNEQRENLKVYLKSKPRIQVNRIFGENSYSFESNWDMFQSFAYGGLIHSNRDKIQKYYAFNLHRDEGKNVVIYPLYRGNIILILLNMTKIIDYISKKVISKIIHIVADSYVKIAEKLIKDNDLEDGWKKLENARYILDYIEDNNGRLEVYKKLEEISLLMKDDDKVNAYKNAYNDIKRVVDGLPPDFSDYKFSAELKKHEESQ